MNKNIENAPFHYLSRFHENDRAALEAVFVNSKNYRQWNIEESNVSDIPKITPK